MSVGTFILPQVSQGGETFKTNIENCLAVLARLGQSFAPHEQATPNMTVRLDAGYLFSGGILTEVAAQNTGTITAPTVNPRIDRVVTDAASGAVSVVTGEEAAPRQPRRFPPAKSPTARSI